jgi:hypothetical protein
LNSEDKRAKAGDRLTYCDRDILKHEKGQKVNDISHLSLYGHSKAVIPYSWSVKICYRIAKILYTIDIVFSRWCGRIAIERKVIYLNILQFEKVPISNVSRLNHIRLVILAGTMSSQGKFLYHNLRAAISPNREAETRVSISPRECDSHHRCTYPESQCDSEPVHPLSSRARSTALTPELNQVIRPLVLSSTTLI